MVGVLNLTFGWGTIYGNKLQELLKQGNKTAGMLRVAFL
jgi:hypothetical protein